MKPIPFLFRSTALCALAVPATGLAAVVLDAPGHAATEGEAVAARGGEPGAAWRLVDWRGREVDGAVGAFDERGEAVIPPLKAGYYRMVTTGSAGEPPTPRQSSTAATGGSGGAGGSPAEPRQALATLAVVSPPLRPEATLRSQSDHLRGEAASSAFAVDTAITWISCPGAFRCPWNGGDTERTVADLVRLCGFRHVRDRLLWRSAQPSPDAPPDFSRNLATATLAKERGAAVSGMFHDAPSWTSPSPKLPGDLGALHRFCAEAAAAFGDSVEDWEFWNEPDIHFAPEPIWEYAAAMKAAYLGFKSARPDLPVLNGALCQMPGKARYFDAFFANDVVPYFDIFNYHTYLPPAKYPEAFGRIRELLRDNGAEGMPVWVTEFGTNLEGHSDRDGVIAGLKAHSPQQELVHAEFYPKAQIALMMEGVERAYFFVFAAFNERNGRKDWGVLRRDGTVKPVFSALATAIRELGDARLLGALDTPEGLRAFLFDRPDGSQTVAFWSESPLDTTTSNSPSVDPEPEFEREWRLDYQRRDAEAQRAAPGDGALPLPEHREGNNLSLTSFHLVDMCGMVSEVLPEADGSLVLPASRFPAYLSGLRGLAAAKGTKAPRAGGSFAGASEAPRAGGSFAGASEAPRADGSFAGAAPSAPSPIVLRPVLDRDDFAISGGKTLAVMKGDTGRARIEVWNFSDMVRTGIVEAAGASVAGLPTEPVTIAPGACAAFECMVAPEEDGRFVETSLPDSPGRDAPTARPWRHDSVLALRGVFDGCAPARAVVPVFFEKRFLETCDRVPIETSAPSLWATNSSAVEQTIVLDEAEKAIRFDAAWHDDRTDRWFYPIHRLDLSHESPVGVRRIVFEVKSVQDKVENDYKTCKLMLASDDGKTDIYLDYDPPTRAWEPRIVDIPPDADLSGVTLVRIGANPLGTRCSLWIRNLEMLK